MTPAPKFSGTVGDFAFHVRVPSLQTTSVNVPPTSTPMTNMPAPEDMEGYARGTTISW